MSKYMILKSPYTLKMMFKRNTAIECDRFKAEAKLHQGHDVYFSSKKMNDGSEACIFGYSLSVSSSKHKFIDL